EKRKNRTVVVRQCLLRPLIRHQTRIEVKNVEAFEPQKIEAENRQSEDHAKQRDVIQIGGSEKEFVPRLPCGLKAAFKIPHLQPRNTNPSRKFSRWCQFQNGSPLAAVTSPKSRIAGL